MTDSPLARLLADQRRRWAAGERPPAEEYCRQFPDLLADPERRLDLIYNEIFLRERAGEAPRLDEYLCRFPDLILKDLWVIGAIKRELAAARQGCPALAGSTARRSVALSA